MSLEELCCKYGRSRDILAHPNQNNPPWNYCRARITETILILTYLFGRLALEGPFLPKRSGILNIYHEEQMSIDNNTFPRRGNKIIEAIFDLEPYSKSLSFLLAIYVSIFSGGEPAQCSFRASMSAFSDGKVHCFVDTLQGLSDSFAKASIIHVGAGSIQYENRLHEHVYDSDHYNGHHIKMPMAKPVQRVGKYLCPFMEDSTSPELAIKAAVEEVARLSFWYHISSKSGETTISPGSFVQNDLREAVAFKIEPTRKPVTRDTRMILSITSNTSVWSMEKVSSLHLIAQDSYCALIMAMCWVVALLL